MDPCLAWTTTEDCVADNATHGCTVQPNTVGCRTTDLTCSPLSCQGGDPFVRRSGQSLRLHDQPYRFVGVNNWGIAWDPNGCKIGEFTNQDAALTRMFDDLVDMKVSVARVWAFQSYADPNGADYSRFDNLVGYARRANVRLIFVLENMWASCSTGDARDDAWFMSGYLSPYGGYTLSYSEYVLGIVKHFRDEPTILAWELMHEAGASDFAALDGFVSNMSALIRNDDSNHLIAIGINGGDNDVTSLQGSPSNYSLLHGHGTVDLVDVHDFNSQNLPITDGELACQAIAASLNKPVFFGAIAVTPDANTAAGFTKRAGLMKAKLDAAFANGYVGALVYDYYPDWTTLSFSFDSRAMDALGGPTGIVEQAAASYNLP